MLFPLSYFPFLLTLILGMFLSISSNSWFTAWIGLELNMLSFIPLITTKMNPYFSESALKYFLIQALGSTLFIMSSCLFIFNMDFSSILLLLSLLLKLGSAPFHYWFPQVMEGLAWSQTIILMSIQKIAPMILISYLMINNINMKITIFSAMLSSLMGALGGLNTLYLRKMMAFSSINHLSWMLISISLSDVFWFFYFIFYSMLSSTIVISFNIFQAFTLSDLMKSDQNKFNITFISFNLLSLGGLPPFTGFIPKWLLIQILIINKLFLPLLILLISALITLYYYLRIVIMFILMINPITITSIKYLSPSSLLSPWLPLLSLLNLLGLFFPILFFL